MKNKKKFWSELDEFLENYLLAVGDIDIFYEKTVSGEYLLDKIYELAEKRDDIEEFTINSFKCPDNIYTAVSCAWYNSYEMNVYNFMFFIKNNSIEENV